LLLVGLFLIVWTVYSVIVVFVYVPIAFFLAIVTLTPRRFQIVCMHGGDHLWGLIMKTTEFWGHAKLKVSGDKLPVRETAIVISNHRWFADWLSILLVAMRKGRMGCAKFFTKASIRYIPGFGWGMWCLDFPFLSRNWADDMKQIYRTFHGLRTRKLPFWLISHLEGTRINPKKLKESQDFAKKKICLY